MDTLLLVEDDITVGRMTLAVLEKRLALPVKWARSLAETRTLLETSDTPFSAAVLDFTLPDAMNGEIIDVVVSKGIPSIVFTATITKDVRNFVWSKKVVDYILKDDPNCLNYLASALMTLRTNTDKKILVVDDSAFFRRVISELLIHHHYQLFLTSTPSEALKVLEQHPDMHLALLDFNMPEMDGCVLCRTIRKKRKKDDLAIIGISAEGDITMAARFIKSGANDFIVKQSFIREEFYCRVNQCIETIDLMRQIKLSAITDYLTGLYNRRYFFEQGEKLFQVAKKSGASLGCVMMDIDHFKKINDTFGHDTGDRVLKTLSKILKSDAGKSDVIARLGGEEFCILVPMPPSEPQGSARIFLEQIESRFDQLRRNIETILIPTGEDVPPVHITVSMGISHTTEHTFEHLLKMADQQLYLAKEAGRNRVMTAFGT